MPGVVAALVLIVVLVSLVATSAPSRERRAADAPIDHALRSVESAYAVGSIGAFRDACTALAVAVDAERSTGAEDALVDQLARAASECLAAVDAGDAGRVTAAIDQLETARRSWLQR